MKETCVLDVDDLWVGYDSNLVLEGIKFSVYRHDFLGIIGPNGGGKTTLLKAILGLLSPFRGEIRVMGKRPSQARGIVGYVPQYSLHDREFPINVFGAVLMGRLGVKNILHGYRSEDSLAAEKALSDVGMLHYRNHQIGKLSGGQQQRVFVARALVSEPQLLLLDEPMSSVDTAMQEDFYQLLSRLKENMAIIIVSHDLSAISVYVDKIACLNKRLYYHGKKEIGKEDLEATYQCPIQMIAHGVPHRVLKEHEDR